MDKNIKIKGRGSSSNTDNRFERQQLRLDPVDPVADEDSPSALPKTQFFRDSSRSIVAENDSPDIPFRYSINPYRGCEHGCAYCYARPTHEYLGFSAGLDFETKIMVKNDAPQLLRERLMKKSWLGESITMSGNTDCYQPAERALRLTRGCLEVLAEFQNPVSIITKNALVVRDIDLLKRLAHVQAANVTLSITTLDNALCGDLEPRTSRPQARLDAVRALSEAGIPVGINVAPIIPGLNDHEIPNILKAAKKAGATHAGMTILRLPLAVAPLFEEWLQVNRPERAEKVLNHIRSIRGGKLNDPNFGSRFRGQGEFANNIRQMFKVFKRKEGFADWPTLSSSNFIRPGDQLSLL